MSNKVLNILNGQCMYDYFKKNKIEKNIIPFNEAMCEGDIFTTDIFSKEFVKERCKVHGTNIDDYKKIVLNPLSLLIKTKFDAIVLWFDEDMFCQINLLTLLGYLDKENFREDIYINLTDDKFRLKEKVKVNVEGYYNTYKLVRIEKSMVYIEELPFLQRGIELYLELQKDNNEIIKYIKNNKQKPKDKLVIELLNNFYNYGLGDVQYIKMIDNINFV